MFSDGENQPVDGIRDWHSLLGTSEEAENYRWPRLGAESTQKIAAINYSSGTTGFPKGVMITHYNLIANVEQVSSSTRGLAYTTSPSAERWISFLPLYHAFGQLFTCLLAAKLLIPVYIMKTFVFEDFLRLIETHKITDMQVAPPILVMLSKRPETSRYDLSSLKTIASGAAPLSKELQAMCAERYNVIITQGWGMTELTSAGTSSRVGIENCGGSIGMLLPNCEARLLDEDGNEVKPHERGEIFIRGPNVSVGYWRNEEATRQAMLPDGWFRTGDIATHDETGRLWIVDRLKVSHTRLPCLFLCKFLPPRSPLKQELIKVNGFQVAPAELEATLLKHDSIADAAVVGITIAGEEWPRAYVALKDSAKGNVQPADIQHWIQARVAKHKRLQGGVVFVDMVPKSASGKIQRKIMSEWAKNDAMKMETMQFKARL